MYLFIYPKNQKNKTVPFAVLPFAVPFAASPVPFAGVLLDQTDEHVAGEIRELVERPGDATITDLHVWKVGPQAHAAIVSVIGEATANTESIRERLKPVHEISHLTVEFRSA